MNGSVIFAGFSAEALRDRILDARSKLVMTAGEMDNKAHVKIKENEVAKLFILKRLLMKPCLSVHWSR